MKKLMFDLSDGGGKKVEEGSNASSSTSAGSLVLNSSAEIIVLCPRFSVTRLFEKRLIIKDAKVMQGSLQVKPYYFPPQTPSNLLHEKRHGPLPSRAGAERSLLVFLPLDPSVLASTSLASSLGHPTIFG